MLSWDSEDEMWSRFVFELVIWLQEVTLARWTQPSDPLCLWQCFFHVTVSPYHFRQATLMANLSCVCPTDSVAPLAAFWLEGVALPTVGGLGLIGNIATIIVLRFDYEDRWETLLRNPIWHRTSPHFYANGRYFKCHTPSFWCPWCKWQLILIKYWIKFWTW